MQETSDKEIIQKLLDHIIKLKGPYESINREDLLKRIIDGTEPDTIKQHKIEKENRASSCDF